MGEIFVFFYLKYQQYGYGKGQEGERKAIVFIHKRILYTYKQVKRKIRVHLSEFMIRLKYTIYRNKLVQKIFQQHFLKKEVNSFSIKCYNLIYIRNKYLKIVMRNQQLCNQS